jgi:HPt (histidine-containing phosphotransfer) domain-containing protein
VINDDIQTMFLHRFTALARTRLANARDAAERNDHDAVAVSVRELHGLAGEAGLLGFADIVPLARAGEDKAKRLCAERTPENAAELIDTLRLIEQRIEVLAKGRDQLAARR